MREQDIRSAALIGGENVEKLNNATVAVFGVGGVGSFAVEALARSGIGTLYLYDNDVVAKSNLNRQLIALESTVGSFKTKVARDRIHDINPNITVIENRTFITGDTQIDFEKFDFIIDAIDNVTAKLHIIEEAKKYNVPIISVMGTGNKLNPSLLQIADIYSTRECPLARVMRTELKKRGIKDLNVVWSSERVKKAAANNGDRTPSSMIFVPASAGIMAAEFVVRSLIS